MKKLRVYNNSKIQYAFVDDDVYQWAKLLRWNLDGSGYVIHSSFGDLEHKAIFLHRAILGLKFNDKQQTDHIDHNKLNNCRNNLRIATASQNQANRILGSNNISGYKGVYWCKKNKKWVTRINVNGKKIWLGYFNDKLDAAAAYDLAALKYFGEFALTNFEIKMLQKVS